MTLTDLPYGTPLRVPDAIPWAEAILGGLDAPITDKNVGYICGWFLREGGGGKNNPLNTTLNAPGAEGSINSDGVKNFATPADGVHATVLTLQGYPAIVASLKTGNGIVGSASGNELHTWSGGGYSAISPISVEVGGMKGVANFKGSLNLETGEWNIRGIPGDGKVEWGTDIKSMAAEIGLSVGPSGGIWRIKGEPANAKPLGEPRTPPPTGKG